MGKRSAPWEKVTGRDLKAPLRHEWQRLGDCGGKLVCYLGRVYTIPESRRGLSGLDVGASTCVHMMKMDGVGCYREPVSSGGKMPRKNAQHRSEANSAFATAQPALSPI